MTTIAEFRALKAKLNAFWDEIEEELALEDKSAEAWKPSAGERCFVLLSNGAISEYTWEVDTYDNACLERGLAFKTREQAELADRKRIIHKKLIDVAGNGGKFKRGGQNHTIAYDVEDDMFYTTTLRATNDLGTVYSQKEDFLSEVLNQIGEDDLNLYMGIGE